VRNIKENVCYVAFNPIREEEIERDNNTEIKEYKLPDGKLIKIGPECFRAPEILFSPSIIGTEYGGVHQCLGNAIFKSDMDLRKKLFSDIVLAGGSTMFTGYGDRLLKEIKSLAQASQCAVCIYIYLYISHFYPFTLLHIILTIILNIIIYIQDVKIKISAPPNRQFLTWMGGSILASLAAFKSMWVTKEEYEEIGASVLHKRTI